MAPKSFLILVKDWCDLPFLNRGVKSFPEFIPDENNERFHRKQNEIWSGFEGSLETRCCI